MKAIRTIIALLPVLVCCTVSFAQVQVSAWEIHQGNEGVIEFKTPDLAARKAAFGKATVPAKSDPSWELAKTQKDGTVNYPDLGENVKKCAEQLDFTYFQAFVNIPKNVDLQSFTVSYDKADDGARIYFFNSKFPSTGGYNEASDLIGNASSYKKVDLKDQLVKGEENRIVIVQYNQCTKNSIVGIRIEVNSKEVAPEVLPTKFRLLTYALHGDRKAEGSNHYMAFSKNNKYNANAYNVFIAKPGDKDGKGEAVTLLELERVEADKDKGIVALKVTNAPIDNMYLLMTDDNKIVISPGRPVYDRGNFYVRKPEEQAAGNLDYVSFESSAWPARKTTSYFVRHQGMNVKLTEATDAARKDKVYRQDASWVFEPIK